jgi:hypothetical protein
MGKIRGKYKPKEDNVQKLIAFLKKLEQKQQNEKKELSK